MGFLRKLLSYKKVCIQCHDNPDADAVGSAFGVYRYLQANGIEADIVYGGTQRIKKNSLKTMIRECGIPVRHVESISDFDLLLTIDCQYGEGNVQKFPAEKVMIIDHHIQARELDCDYMICSVFHSCAALVYKMLKEEGYPVKEDQGLVVSLLFGLYTDTAGFADLFHAEDIILRTELYEEQPLFDRLTKMNMSVAELMIASDAMYHHYLDIERGFALVGALKCDQSVLGIIGDFMIQVDMVLLSLVYTQANTGYQLSMRTCHEGLRANEIMAYLCDGIGSGGGHARKAGGRIWQKKMEEKYGTSEIGEIMEKLLSEYIDTHPFDA
ncbi:MAG: DHH family phosphoesterase [Bacillota bacterium]|nr:DHH family phosphoesterase [Bacillota bacterium]